MTDHPPTIYGIREALIILEGGTVELKKLIEEAKEWNVRNDILFHKINVIENFGKKTEAANDMMREYKGKLKDINDEANGILSDARVKAAETKKDAVDDVERAQHAMNVAKDAVDEERADLKGREDTLNQHRLSHDREMERLQKWEKGIDRREHAVEEREIALMHDQVRQVYHQLFAHHWLL